MLFPIGAFLALVPAAQEPTPPALPVLPHAELLAQLGAISGAERLFVGKSREGRTIEAVRVRANETPRPAILVVANIDGSQAWSSSLALHHARTLAAKRAEEPFQALLEHADVIVLPCANPDVHERRFAKPLDDDEASFGGVDEDRDGRSGEDPAADIDGDGFISWMRYEDPEGEWMLDPADARALVKADRTKGERGRYKLVREGRDLDRDEKVAEDGPLEALVNRNFPEEYRDNAPEAGRFPMEAPEARALADFLILHPEIALVVTYGSLDNVVEKPKGVADTRNKRVPLFGVLEADVELLGELGKRHTELVGSKAKSRGVEAGSFQAWCYGHRGLWSLAIQPWDIPLDAKKAGEEEKKPEGGENAAEKPAEKPAKKDKREPSDDAKRLVWLDANAGESARFVAWHEFTHPELGKVELGGWAPFARSEPPESERAALAEKELQFLATLGAELPRVRVAEFTAKPLGSGVFEVEAVLENDGRMPLANASGRRTGEIRPLRVELALGAGETLLGGDTPLQLVRELAGSGGRAKWRWLVRTKAPAELTLRFDSDHAGRGEARANVKETR